MKNWELTITKVSNGYVVSGYNCNNEEDYSLSEVHQEIGDNDDHIISMLYNILEHFGENLDHFSKRMIVIGYRKGRKFEGIEDIGEGVEFPILEEVSKDE